MKPLVFENFERLPVIQFYEEAFRKATGVLLKVIPADESTQRLNLGEGENPFCKLVARTPAACEGCRKTQVRVRRIAGKTLTFQQINCFAGFTDVAVPVVMAGRDVASLMSGQVFRREPTERDFKMVAGMLRQDDIREKGARRSPEWLKKHFVTPGAVTPGAAMPPQKFSETILGAIVLFMLSQIGEGAPGYYASMRVIPSTEQGQHLFQQKGCIGCHTVAGQGGKVGPVLDDAACVAHPNGCCSASPIPKASRPVP